jgi:hypothetical protein
MMPSSGWPERNRKKCRIYQKPLRRLRRNFLARYRTEPA